MNEWKEFFNVLLESQGVKEGRVFWQFALITAAVSVAVCLALYILKAVSVYRMAKTAGLTVPWLAFVPILNLYTFGRLAELAIKRDGAKPTKYGALLLFLDLVKRILGAAAGFLLLLRITTFFDQPDEITVSGIIRKLLPTLFLAFLLFGVGLAEMIIRYVALYRIFWIFNYPNATLFTLLSVLGMFFLSDILEPIFLFLSRKNPPVFDYREKLERKENLRGE